MNIFCTHAPGTEKRFIVYGVLKNNIKNYSIVFRDLYELKDDTKQEKKFINNFYSSHNDKAFFIDSHKEDFFKALADFKLEVKTLKNIDKQIETNLIKKRLIPILEKA